MGHGKGIGNVMDGTAKWLARQRLMSEHSDRTFILSSVDFVRVIINLLPYVKVKNIDKIMEMKKTI